MVAGVKSLREVIAGLRDELRVADLRTWFLVIVSLWLTTVWLYFGSPRFFRERLGGHLAGDPWADWYPYLYYHLAAVLLIGVLPLAVMRLGFRVRLADLGLQLGDWRFGVKAVVVLCLLLTPLLFFIGIPPAVFSFSRAAGETDQ